jgi:hypothetical protein
VISACNRFAFPGNANNFTRNHIMFINSI